MAKKTSSNPKKEKEKCNACDSSLRKNFLGELDCFKCFPENFLTEEMLDLNDQESGEDGFNPDE